MFVELLQGNAADPKRFRKAWERVLEQVADEGSGYRGTTSGVTEAGTFVALVGFESEETARITLDRLHELSAWDQLKALTAPLTFRECPHVRGFARRDLLDADVVQVSQGQALDTRQVVSAFERAVRAAATDESILGGLVCWDADGFATTVLYRLSPEEGTADELEALTRDLAVLVQRAAQFDLVGPWSIMARPVAKVASAMPDDDDAVRP
jgi:hypothetical protein